MEGRNFKLILNYEVEMQTMKLGLYLEKHVFFGCIISLFVSVCFYQMICVLHLLLRSRLKIYSFINFVFWTVADGGCLHVGMHMYL